MNQRLVQQHGRVVEEKPGLERVGGVHDQVVRRQQARDIRRSNILLPLVEAQCRVEQTEPAGRRFDFRPANVALLEEDLAVQVGEFHPLVIDESQMAHAGRGKIEGHR